jgi:hypothetical protein
MMEMEWNTCRGRPADCRRLLASSNRCDSTVRGMGDPGWLVGRPAGNTAVGRRSCDPLLLPDCSVLHHFDCPALLFLSSAFPISSLPFCHQCSKHQHSIGCCCWSCQPSFDALQKCDLRKWKRWMRKEKGRGKKI